MSVYNLLLAESKLVGLPTSFCTDLTVHDQRCLLQRDAPQRFGWALRQTGTLLIDPRMSTTNLEGHLSHFDFEPHRLYLIDGVSLTLVSLEEFRSTLRTWHLEVDKFSGPR